MKARKSVFNQFGNEKGVVANLHGDETIDQFPDTRSIADKGD